MESREEQRTCLRSRGRVSRTRLRIGVRREIDDPYLPRKVNSRLERSLFRKSRADRLTRKSLKRNSTKKTSVGGKAPLSTREPSTDFLPAFLPSHYRPSTKKTLNAHAPPARTYSVGAPFSFSFIFSISFARRHHPSVPPSDQSPYF